MPGQSHSAPQTHTRSKMPFRTSKSAKSRSVKNRLSESLEDADYLSEEEVSVFGEDDIILVEYKDSPNTPLKKGNKSKKKKKKSEGHSQKNQSEAFDFLDIDIDNDDFEVPEAIVIDFDTPTRKLVMEARVNLKKLNMRQQLKESKSSASCRSTKLKLKKQKKRQAEKKEEEEEDETDDDEVSPNIASLMAKRSKLSHKLADQRRNKRICTV